MYNVSFFQGGSTYLLEKAGHTDPPTLSQTSIRPEEQFMHIPSVEEQLSTAESYIHETGVIKEEIYLPKQSSTAGVKKESLSKQSTAGVGSYLTRPNAEVGVQSTLCMAQNKMFFFHHGSILVTGHLDHPHPLHAKPTSPLSSGDTSVSV